MIKKMSHVDEKLAMLRSAWIAWEEISDDVVKVIEKIREARKEQVLMLYDIEDRFKGSMKKDEMEILKRDLIRQIHNLFPTLIDGVKNKHWAEDRIIYIAEGCKDWEDEKVSGLFWITGD